jgi:hypothetical protein
MACYFASRLYQRFTSARVLPRNPFSLFAGDERPDFIRASSSISECILCGLGSKLKDRYKWLAFELRFANCVQELA